MNATETILTLDNLPDDQPYALPCDMASEITEALRSGRETHIDYRREWEYSQEATHFIYFPTAGRGGACEGGNTDWTDCDGLDDLAERWANYDEQWSN